MIRQLVISASLLFILQIVHAGTYVEFSMKGQAANKGGAEMEGSMKAWFQDGNTRSRFQMNLPPGMDKIPGMPGIGNMVMLKLKDQPGKAYMMDESNKTYFETPEGAEKDAPEEDFDITIIGQEKVNGYNATHLKAVSKITKSVMDWWVSKDVAGYQEMKNFRTRQFNTNSLYKWMDAKSVEGFPVKMIMSRGQERFMEMNLVKAEKMDIPASQFSLDGYTKREGSPFMPGGMDPEKLKNMSPEDRIKFFQELQKSMQKN